jgi:hypothetical protein
MEFFRAKVFHVRVMHPALEPAVRLTSNVWWPWVAALLLVLGSMGMVCDHRGVTAGSLFALLAWNSPIYVLADLRNWRMLVTAQNTLVGIIISINLACLVALSTREKDGLALVIAFSLFVGGPTIPILFQLTDHDAYGFFVFIPQTIVLYCAILYAFLTRGSLAFIKPASDILISLKGQPIFSVVGVMAGTVGTLVSMFIAVALFFKQNRDGLPRHNWLLGLVSLRYRDFHTDKIFFSSRRNIALLAAAHGLLVLCVILAAALAEKRAV